ncbi:hypothetical protein CALVIDRAFT_542918 [Calocera viscosa TUFC12733]|uniref:Uncharacterized protein n=1 Tax=Calocera viscosa (strain TUFC12733) TaxID=1330018 RepID=A0A167G4R2_CALVF|nr:hypothetical protein CALVIDRAFT_542918 [Calocera viscosa TUFC12733]
MLLSYAKGTKTIGPSDPFEDVVFAHQGAWIVTLLSSHSAPAFQWFPVVDTLLRRYFTEQKGYVICPYAAPEVSSDNLDYITLTLNHPRTTKNPILFWQVKAETGWTSLLQQQKTDEQMRDQLANVDPVDSAFPFIFGISSVGDRLQLYIYDIQGDTIYPKRPLPKDHEEGSSAVLWFGRKTSGWYRARLFQKSGIQLLKAIEVVIRHCMERIEAQNPNMGVNAEEIAKAIENRLEEARKADKQLVAEITEAGQKKQLKRKSTSSQHGAKGHAAAFGKGRSGNGAAAGKKQRTGV